jgi:hypothetical protein
VAVGIFGTDQSVTKWRSLQDTFVMNATTHPLEKFPVWKQSAPLIRAAAQAFTRFLIFHPALISLGVLTVGLNMAFASVMRQPRPSTRARDKCSRRLVICPGTKSVDAGWPVRAVDDMIVHEHSTLPNRLGYA